LVFHCSYCEKEFIGQTALRQHTSSSHSREIILLDENIHSKDISILEIKNMGFFVQKFPNHLKGQPDHVVINYAKQKEFGLATYDKKCSYTATICIAPVFLVVVKNSQLQIYKIN
jgi:hypothetical protein